MNKKDNYNIVSGHVIISDKKSNNILFEGDNMIVGEGRNFILSKVISGIAEPTLSDNVSIRDYSAYKYWSMFISNNSSEVNINDTAASFGASSETSSNRGEIISITNFEVNISDRTITLGVSITGETGVIKNYSSLGIVISDSDTSSNNKILLSRIKFDTVVLTADSHIDIRYILYF